MTRGKLHWGDFTRQLQQAFPAYQVLPVDLAGNGSRFREESPVDICVAVEDIRHQLQCLQVEPPYNVLALSLGGMITLQWIKQYPEELDFACVINTSHAGLCSLFERIRPLSMLILLSAVFMPLQWREKQVFRLTSNQPYNQAIIDSWVQIAKEEPVSIPNFVRQMRLARSFTQAISNGSRKLVFLASRADKLVNPVCSEAIAQAVGAPLFFHGSAGHEITLDDPLWVIDCLHKCFDGKTSDIVSDNKS